jgi:bifunctional DNA-binding transcriptional regulator/antitoxin component of YhaV-PrlF toxin-antitoxin module
MTTRKSEEKNIRKITKVGKTSLAITIPIEMRKDLGWREKQKVKVKRIKGGIEVKDCRSK